MSKRTVRLTESELNNIITESVKNIISELDWKTYRNAAEKNKEREGEYSEMWWKLERQINAAIERGDLETANKLRMKQSAYTNKSLRGTNFMFASNNAFDNKYLSNSINRLNNSKSDFTNFVRKSYDDGSYSTDEPWMDGYGNIHNGHYFEPHGKVDGKYYDDELQYRRWDNQRQEASYLDGEWNGRDSDALSDDTLKSMGFPDNEINDIEKARREIRRYRNGDYQFTKGKGWHLKNK